jgi:hypothetical protein
MPRIHKSWPHRILSGPDVSLIFNKTRDLLNPQNGEILSIGGNLSDHTLGANTSLATRLKLGLEDTLNGRIDGVPLSERFFPEARAACVATACGVSAPLA